MNLRYLVPVLGILASTSGLYAENVGNLTVGGFVDTIGAVSDTEEDGSGTAKAFSAAVELRLGYKIGDKVSAQVDMEWNNGMAGDTDLEQAYINYVLSDTVSVTSGKFTSYSGWTAADADGLYRINGSPITALYVIDLIGVAVNFAPSEDLGISLFLVNGMDSGAITGLPNSSYNDATNDHVGIAGDVVFKVKDVGTFNAEAGYDQITADVSYLNVAGNATIKLASYEPLTIGAEVMFDSISDDESDDSIDRVGFLLMGNHTVPMSFPASVTGMFTMVSTSADVGGGTADTDVMEIAAALLTNPTGDSHVGVNAELAYRVESGDTSGPNSTDPSDDGDDINSLSFSVELIAVIP